MASDERTAVPTFNIDGRTSIDFDRSALEEALVTTKGNAVLLGAGGDLDGDDQAE